MGSEMCIRDRTTITYPYSGWIATSPLEVIAMNLFYNQHTLALLDLDPTGAGTGKQVPMQPKDACHSLRLMKEKIRSMIEDISEDTITNKVRKSALVEFIKLNFDDLKVVLCAVMGSVNENISYTTISKLEGITGGRLNCLVFPAVTSEVEEKALLRW